MIEAVDRRFNGVALEARLQAGGQTTGTRLYATDLAKGGIFLEMATPPAPGTVLRILLAVLPGKFLPLDARVVRAVSPDEASRMGILPGVGLKFEGLTVATRELLDRAIEAAAQVVAPDPVAELPADALEPIAETPLRSQPSFLVRRMLDAYKTKADERVRRAQEFFEAGKAAFEAGMWVKASAELQTALGFDPDNPEIKALAARAHAKACVAKAATAWNQGEYFESIGDRRSAAAQFLEAARLAPENPDYTRRTAAYAFTDGDLKQARHWLLLSLESRPHDPEAHALLAMVYEAAGHAHNARREAERALSLAPARKDLVMLVQRLKNSG